MIENYDRYSKLNLELDFLKRLDAAALFTPEVVLALSSDPDELMPDLGERSEPVLSLETIKDRELRLAEMKPHQIESLKRNQEMFDELSPERREAIANFHQQLFEEKNKKSLVRTMVDYYDWLKSLTQSQRIEVLDEDNIDRRIKMVAAKIEQQNLKNFGRAGATMLPATDTEPFFKWYQAFLKTRKPQIIHAANNLYSTLYRKRSDGKQPPPAKVRQFQRYSLSQKIEFMDKADRDRLKALISEGDVEQLRHQLSLDSNELLDNQEALEEQQSLIASWIGAANQAKFNIDPKRLRGFYSKLPKEKRDELDDLSPADWKSELKRLYRQKRFRAR